jgi:hypothetical protein
MNGHGWALAVEKLLGVPAPPRAEAIRVILSEFSRIMDHFVCISTNVVDLGAITPYFWVFRVREEIYDLLDACSGARLTVSYVRIGGLANDVPADFADRCRVLIKSVADATREMDRPSPATSSREPVDGRRHLRPPRMRCRVAAVGRACAVRRSLRRPRGPSPTPVTTIRRRARRPAATATTAPRMRDPPSRASSSARPSSPRSPSSTTKARCAQADSTPTSSPRTTAGL